MTRKKEMFSIILTILCLFPQYCLGINLVDLPDSAESDSNYNEFIKRRDMNPKPSASNPPPGPTKHWLYRQAEHEGEGVAEGMFEDDKDKTIKEKITQLVQQTLHDTEGRIKSVQYLKENNREAPPYRIGFILSLVKKAKEILNELFNVAVKHRDSWRALEQLKIFELIVHTNVDTTNLVRQLVEIHIQNLNATSSSSSMDKRRVVLL